MVSHYEIPVLPFFDLSRPKVRLGVLRKEVVLIARGHLLLNGLTSRCV